MKCALLPYGAEPLFVHPAVEQRTGTLVATCCGTFGNCPKPGKPVVNEVVCGLGGYVAVTVGVGVNVEVGKGRGIDVPPTHTVVLGLAPGHGWLLVTGTVFVTVGSTKVEVAVAAGWVEVAVAGGGTRVFFCVAAGTVVLVAVAVDVLVSVGGTGVSVGTAGVLVGWPPEGGADVYPFAVTAYRPAGRSGTRNGTDAFPPLASGPRPGPAT